MFLHAMQSTRAVTGDGKQETLRASVICFHCTVGDGDESDSSKRKANSSVLCSPSSVKKKKKSVRFTPDIPSEVDRITKMDNMDDATSAYNNEDNAEDEQISHHKEANAGGKQVSDHNQDYAGGEKITDSNMGDAADEEIRGGNSDDGSKDNEDNAGDEQHQSEKGLEEPECDIEQLLPEPYKERKYIGFFNAFLNWNTICYKCGIGVVVKSLSMHMNHLHGHSFATLEDCLQHYKVIARKFLDLTAIHSISNAYFDIAICKICVKAYSNKWNLKQHLKSFHRFSQTELDNYFMEIKSKRKKKTVNHKVRSQYPMPSEVTTDDNSDAVCKICKNRYRDYDALLMHLRQCHSYKVKRFPKNLVQKPPQKPKRNNEKVREQTESNNQDPSSSTADIEKQDPLSVAILMADDSRLNKDQAIKVKKLLLCKILKEAKNPSKTSLPRFTTESIFADGALKLQCNDEYTLNWLRDIVKNLYIEECPGLTLKRQCDLNTVRITLSLPDCDTSVEDALIVLWKQNDWASVEHWTVLSHELQSNKSLFLVLAIPEHIFPLLEKENLQLFYNLGSVKVHLYESGCKEITVKGKHHKGKSEKKRIKKLTLKRVMPDSLTGV